MPRTPFIPLPGASQKSPRLSGSRPAIHVISIVIGISFLALINFGVRVQANISNVASIAVVIVGAIVFTVPLAIISEHFVSESDGKRQVRLQTILLAFIPISVYLSALYWLQVPPPPDPELTDWLRYAVIAGAGAWVSTTLMLRFANGLLWLFMPLAATMYGILARWWKQ